MLKYFRFTILVVTTCFLTNCQNNYKKAFEEIKNLPKADYSYAVEPEFISPKSDLEFKIKGLYDAEETRFSIAKFHGYDNKTKEQINEDYWVSFIIYNSTTIEIYDESQLFIDGKKIAKLVMESLKNKNDYDKVQITFIKQWKEGDNIKKIKHSEFYKYPSFEKTSR